MNTFKSIGVGAVVFGAIIALAVWAQRGPSETPEPSPSVSLPAGQAGESVSPIAIPSESSLVSITPKNNMHEITISTNLGDIVFQTYDTDAPNTSKNFIDLAQKGFYDKVIFHRVISGFMIQGGDPTGTGRGGPGYTFADELDPNTESYKRGYVAGTVAMANSGPDTNGSQFFIMHQDYPLPHQYTIFGHVVRGQDVVNKIAAVKTDADDTPLTPVVMRSVTVKDLN